MATARCTRTGGHQELCRDARRGGRVRRGRPGRGVQDGVAGSVAGNCRRSRPARRSLEPRAAVGWRRDGTGWMTRRLRGSGRRGRRGGIGTFLRGALCRQDPLSHLAARPSVRASAPLDHGFVAADRCLVLPFVPLGASPGGTLRAPGEGTLSAGFRGGHLPFPSDACRSVRLCQLVQLEKLAGRCGAPVRWFPSENVRCPRDEEAFDQDDVAVVKGSAGRITAGSDRLQ